MNISSKKIKCCKTIIKVNNKATVRCKLCGGTIQIYRKLRHKEKDLKLVLVNRNICWNSYIALDKENTPKTLYRETNHKYLLRINKHLHKLEHPGIPKVYKATRTDLLRDYVQGRNLYHYINKIPIKGTLSLIYNLIDILEYTQTYGITHENVRPAKILIDRNNQVKLIGLGINTHCIGNSHYYKLTEDYSYMSPSYMTDGTADFLDNIYNLGMIMYHSLTKKAPFPRVPFIDLLYLYPKGHKNIRIVAPKLPEELIVIVEKATAKKREDRYSSYSNFKRDIKNIWKSYK
ncbi:serine/threonine protein kinase [Candidatus Uabimicrobium sp. HlEnr_7]|uniref:serine/threonine protein kinase n=1 Tax=Candidatus Uabimicrobium helgolandensis TaxID=3095367 RepID=UPI0035573AC9